MQRWEAQLSVSHGMVYKLITRKINRLPRWIQILLSSIKMAAKLK